MFSFSIRDAPWLTVVVALAEGWWQEGRRRHYELRVMPARKAYFWKTSKL